MTGQLTQLPGTAGCTSNNGSGGACVDGKSLFFPRSVTVSPNGENVYVVATDAVAVFARNTTTGELTQLAATDGCVSETGTAGACADGKAIDGTLQAAVSPDGKNLYVASQVSDAVAAFTRNTTTGELTQLAGTAGCVSQTGTGGACADGKGLDNANAVAVSADGQSVYVTSNGSNAVAAFQRNTTTGELTQLAGADGCISETGGVCRDGRVLLGAGSVAVSADGKSVYIGSTYPSNAVAVLSRNTTTGALFQPAGTGGCVSETGTGGRCRDGKALESAKGVAISANDKSVYVASIGSDAVAAFGRNTTTGALTQLVGPSGKAGCVSETGSGGACADGKALDYPYSVAVSADGQSVYVASAESDAVAVLKRNATSGALTQLAGRAGCVSQTGTAGTCRDGKALDGPTSVAVAADGQSVYANATNSNAVTAFARETPP